MEPACLFCAKLESAVLVLVVPPDPLGVFEGQKYGICGVCAANAVQTTILALGQELGARGSAAPPAELQLGTDNLLRE